MLHSMWLLKFGQPRQPQRCSHPCRNPRKLDSCAGLSIFQTRLTDAEPGRQFPRLPFPETLFRNAGFHSQGRRYERGRLLARAAWFQATWVCNYLGASAARQVLNCRTLNELLHIATCHRGSATQGATVSTPELLNSLACGQRDLCANPARRVRSRLGECFRE